MADPVLEFLRSKDARLNDVPDDVLTRFAGDNYPELLKVPEFAKVHALRVEQAKNHEAGAGDKPGITDTLKQLPGALATMVAGKQEDDQAAQGEEHDSAFKDWVKDRVKGLKAVAHDYAHALTTGNAHDWTAAALAVSADDLGLGPVERGLSEASKATGKFGRDVVKAVTPGMEDTIAGDVAEGIGSAAPLMAGGVAAGAAEVPAALALGGMAAAQARGSGEGALGTAVAGLTGGLLPAAEHAGREIVGKVLGNELLNGTKITLTKLANGKIASEVATRLPGISAPTVQRALEFGGGQLAANALLTASEAPHILEDKDPAKAFEHAVIGNLGLALLGAPEILRGGGTETQRAFYQGASEKLRRGEGIFPTELKTEPQPAGENFKQATGTVQPEEVQPVPQPPVEVASQPPVEVAPQPPVEVAPQPPVEVAPQPPVEVAPQPPVEAAPQPPVEVSPESSAVISAPEVQAALRKDEPQGPTLPSGNPPEDVNLPAPPPTPIAPIAGKQPDWLVGEFGPHVTFGRETVVNGANKQKYRAVYAWAPRDALQTSHVGSRFNVNPDFSPAKNTRDYATDAGEQEKVYDIARNYDPYSYVNDAPSASIGPAVVSLGKDGKMRVAGGNGRTQATQFLQVPQINELNGVLAERAANYGLPPWPGGSATLVRFIESHDPTTPEGVDSFNKVIDFLNPSDSRAEATSTMAVNDGAKLPADVVLKVNPKMTTTALKEWMGSLIGSGAIDRNTRSRIRENEAELRQYINNVYLHSAFRRHDIIRAYDNPASALQRELIAMAAKPALQLRMDGEHKIADAIGEMLTRAIQYQKEHPLQNIRMVLSSVAAQIESQSRTDKFVRGLAQSLLEGIEMAISAKRGTPSIDFHETEENWRGLFERFSRALDIARAGSGTDDIFGIKATTQEVIEGALRNVSATVAEAMRNSPKGQMSLFPPTLRDLAETPAQKEVRRAEEIKAAEQGLFDTLKRGPLLTKGDQTLLFEDPKQLFKGKTPNYGPTLRLMVRKVKEGNLPGFQKEGKPKPPPVVQDLVTVRADLMPPRPTKQNYAAEVVRPGDLTPQQQDGVNRIVDAWKAGQRFGLFDGAGAGKTRQEIAAAMAAHKIFGDKQVLIVSQNEKIIEDAITRDADAMGVPAARFQGGGFLYGVPVYVSTYDDIAADKIKPGLFKTIIWDEAHLMRNDAKNTLGQKAMAIDDAAERSVYATATPLDRPDQIGYLSKLYKRSVRSVLERMGWDYQEQPLITGATERVFEAPEKRDPVLEAKIADEVFDEVYQAGLGIKREVSLDGLKIETAHVPLDESTKDDFKQYLEDLEDQYSYLGPRKGGVIMQAARRWLERSRVPWVMDQVDHALKGGRQVFIVAESVNESADGAGGTLTALATMLERKYGAGSVAKIFGGTRNKADERYFEDAKQQFQNGEIKIAIGNPSQAGTGISLDDQHGNAPRTTLLLTPPLSSIQFLQILGRTWRLTTRSMPIVRMPDSGHFVDRWGMDLVRRKIDMLRGVIGSDIPKPEREPTAPNDIARSRTAGARQYKDPRQVEFEALLSLETLGDTPLGESLSQAGQSATNRSARGRVARQRPRLEAGGLVVQPASVVIRRYAQEHGTVGAIGLPVRDVHDVAALACQFWRNTAIEVLRVVLVKDGKIVHVASSTSFLPDAVMVFGESMRPFWAQTMEMARRLGADGAFMSHNHASADPLASHPDKQCETRLSSETVDADPHVQAFKALYRGFIITDHREYTVLSSNETGEQIERRHSINDVGPDPLLNEQMAYPLHTPQYRETLLQAVQMLGHKQPVIILADVMNQSRGVIGTNLEQLDHPALANDLATLMKSHGATQAHLYYDGPEHPQIANARRSNLFVTVQSRKGESYHPNAKTPGPTTAQAANYLRNVDEREPMQMQLPGTNETVPIKLGGMEIVRPLEMPEIVRLSRMLSGFVPRIKNIPTANGYFKPVGAKGRITLDARIFANPLLAAQVMAHELGHMIDYLPHATMQRGNLLGRLASLRSFMNNQLPGTWQTNKELREELTAVSDWWRPWDKANATEGMKRYRASSEELYADALSVLLNDPKALLDRAPGFYYGFFDHLDAKPEVKAAFFGLQDLLRDGKVTVLETRQGERRKGYEIGEIKQAELAAARAAVRDSLSGWWTRLLQVAVDRYQPIRTKQSQAERMKGAGPLQAFGITNLPRSMDAREAAERVQLNDVMTMRLARRVWETVVKPIEARGLSLVDLGEYQELRRIVYGDSQKLANPGGEAPMTARQGLLLLHSQVGHDGWDTLMRADEAFRRATWPVITEAYKSGLYTDDLFASLKANRDTYAAFGVLKYLEDYVPAALKARVGTLEQVGNPVITTLLKMITIQRASAHNRAKTATVNLLQSYFPDEIAVAKPHEKPPRGRGELLVQVKGVPTVYHVDPFIAKAFERVDDPVWLEHLVKPLDWAFRNVFYPAMIKFNPSFGLFLSPARDMQRSVRNVAGALEAHGQNMVAADVRSMAEMLRNGGRALRESARRSSKTEPDPRPFRKPGDPPMQDIIREMEGVFAIATPYQTFRDIYRADTFGRVMQRYHLLPSTAEVQGAAKLQKTLEHYFSGLERAAVILDTAPKIDAYLSLRRQGVPREQAAVVTRNFTGLPNVTRRGMGVGVFRATIPFWNVFVQGVRSDFNLFVNPSTMGGMFLRWGLGRGGLRILASLAAAGAFGAVLKRLYGGMSEYDKTNYLTLPVGQMGGGLYGPKTVFLRVPEDDLGRLLGGTMHKVIQGLAGQGVNRLPTELFDFGSGQIPTVNPAIEIPQKWMEYASGVNPIDPFHQRPIVPPTAFSAGGLDSLQPMALWTVNQTGYGDFLGVGGAVKLGANALFHFDQSKQTTTEAVVSSVPVLNRILKISDYGFREAQDADIKAQQSDRDRETLKYPAEVQSLRAERGALARTPFANRTQAQQDRYEELERFWYAGFKRDDEKVRSLDDEGKKAEADQLRAEMRKDAAQFVAKPNGEGFKWGWDTSIQTDQQKAQPATKAQLRQLLRGKQGVNAP